MMVGAAWGLGASLNWMLARSDYSESLWFGWWPWTVLGIAFLVGTLRPLLKGVLTLSVASIVVGSAAFSLWWAFETATCSHCFSYDVVGSRFEAWRDSALMAGFWAIFLIGAVGAGGLVGWEVNHWWQRLNSQPPA